MSSANAPANRGRHGSIRLNFEVLLEREQEDLRKKKERQKRQKLNMQQQLSQLRELQKKASGNN